ncbi:hypothetical protein CL658_05080 [bacterium]|nr:hypothetical protein [bacterium]
MPLPVSTGFMVFVPEDTASVYIVVKDENTYLYPGVLKLFALDIAILKADSSPIIAFLFCIYKSSMGSPVFIIYFLPLFLSS